MDGPHNFGFSPVALCINFTSVLASARLVGSSMAAINAGTLNLVGLVLLCAILFASRLPAKPNTLEAAHSRGRLCHTIPDGSPQQGPDLHRDLGRFRSWGASLPPQRSHPSQAVPGPFGSAIMAAYVSLGEPSK